MTLQYSLYLNINIPGRKIFHAYYYRSSVPYAERTKSVAPTASYCYCQDAVTILIFSSPSISLSLIFLIHFFIVRIENIETSFMKRKRSRKLNLNFKFFNKNKLFIIAEITAHCKYYFSLFIYMIGR
jgi:hypothetical protein